MRKNKEKGYRKVKLNIWVNKAVICFKCFLYVKP